MPSWANIIFQEGIGVPLETTVSPSGVVPSSELRTLREGSSRNLGIPERRNDFEVPSKALWRISELKIPLHAFLDNLVPP